MHQVMEAEMLQKQRGVARLRFWSQWSAHLDSPARRSLVAMIAGVCALAFHAAPASAEENPDLVRCFCRDESVVEVCANIDCTQGPPQDVVCEPVCSHRGGLVGTGCFDNDNACLPPPPANPDLVRCFCRNGSVVEVCGNIDCTQGPPQDVVCEPVCSHRGGLWGTGCFDNDNACMP